MEAVIKTKAKKGRTYLPPNLYSGAFLLGRHFGMDKASFVLFKEPACYPQKLYIRNGKIYTVPFVNEAPPKGYNWLSIGRLHGREMFVVTRTIRTVDAPAPGC